MAVARLGGRPDFLEKLPFQKGREKSTFWGDRH